jgi:hypothetical protein
MTVKKYLADLYLTGAGSNSDPEKLITKIKYYQEFLDVIGKVDRGYPPVSYKPLVTEKKFKKQFQNIFICQVRQRVHLVDNLQNGKWKFRIFLPYKCNAYLFLSDSIWKLVLTEMRSNFRVGR